MLPVMGIQLASHMRYGFTRKIVLASIIDEPF
jgi:hypothetical protein